MRSGMIWIVLLLAAAGIGWVIFGGQGEGGGQDYADGIDGEGDDAAMRDADGVGCLVVGNANGRVGKARGIEQSSTETVVCSDLRIAPVVDPKGPIAVIDGLPGRVAHREGRE